MYWGMPDLVDHRPVAGVDYPSTLVEFDAFFPDEAACRQFLERLRWPSGFVCPACGRGPGWRMERGLHLCPGCRRQVSATAGTLFEKMRKPLRQWFLAVWEVTSAKYGASALGMQRVLGLRSYEMAWAWQPPALRRAVGQSRHRGCDRQCPRLGSRAPRSIAPLAGQAFTPDPLVRGRNGHPPAARAGASHERAIRARARLDGPFEQAVEEHPPGP